MQSWSRVQIQLPAKTIVKSLGSWTLRKVSGPRQTNQPEQDLYQQELSAMMTTMTLRTEIGVRSSLPQSDLQACCLARCRPGHFQVWSRRETTWRIQTAAMISESTTRLSLYRCLGTYKAILVDEVIVGLRLQGRFFH